jgi:hypothetical protein
MAYRRPVAHRCSSQAGQTSGTPQPAPADPGQTRLARHEVVDGLINEYKNAA